MPKSEDDNVRATEPVLPSHFRCWAHQCQYLSTGFCNTTPTSAFSTGSKQPFTIPEDRVVIDRSRHGGIELGDARPGMGERLGRPSMSLARTRTVVMLWCNVKKAPLIASHSLQLVD
jgi:hypothetical protein